LPSPIRCAGCGALVPDVPELRSDHLYVGAAPGCYAAFGELLGRHLSGHADGETATAHMLATDAYMAQHPGTPGRQSAQSVWVHLVGLCLSLEHGFDPVASAYGKATVAAPEAVLEWLEPPAQGRGAVTVLDALSAAPDALPDAIRRWAESVWAAWEPHHAAVRERAARVVDRRR
jgi:hypothetical protein